jgi:hypothetical protein
MIVYPRGRKIDHDHGFGDDSGAQLRPRLAIANDTGFGLCAGICTTSLKRASHFKRNSEAGMLRSTRRGLETWHGRDGVTLADERASQQGTRTST